VVRLYDAKGVQLAYAQTNAALAGDARLDVALPHDGKYTVEVHDALYRGGNPGYFRLKLGDLHYADLAYPLGVQQGRRGILGFASSNLPGQASVEMEALSPGLRLSASPAAGPGLSSATSPKSWRERLRRTCKYPRRLPSTVSCRRRVRRIAFR
jgi:hypothetical protein